MARSTDPSMLHFNDDPDGHDDDEREEDETISGLDDPEEELDPQERRRRDRGDYVDRGADDDEEEESDPEEEEEEEPEARAPRRRGDSGSIPRERFNEVVAQRNELIEAMRGLPEALVAAARSGAAAPAKKEEEPPAYPMAAKLREHAKLLLDGEEDKAAELMAEILTENAKTVARSVEEATTERVMRQTRAEREAADVEDVLSRAFDKYPHISGDTDKAREIQDEIVMYRNHYMTRQNLPMAKALEKAIERVAPTYAPKGKKERDDARGGEDLLAAARRRAAEKRAAETQPQRNIDRIRRNVTANNAQPPSMARSGASGKPRDGADKVTARQIAAMSDAEYAQLSPEDKKKLRGDDVKA